MNTQGDEGKQETPGSTAEALWESKKSDTQLKTKRETQKTNKTKQEAA